MMKPFAMPVAARCGWAFTVALVLLAASLTSAAAQARLPAGIERGVPSRGYGGGPGIGLGGIIGIVPHLIPRGGAQEDDDDPPPRRRPIVEDEPRPERYPERNPGRRAVEPQRGPTRRPLLREPVAEEMVRRPGKAAQEAQRGAKERVREEREAKKPAPLPPREAKGRTRPPVPAASPAGAPAPAAAATAGEVPGEVLFALRPEAGPAAPRAVLAGARLDLVSSDSFTLVPVTLHRARSRDRRAVATILAALDRDPRVASAQANHTYALAQGGLAQGALAQDALAQGAPAQSAPAFGSVQYASAKLKLDEAHRSATGRDVAVAVIDSGIDADHPALKGAVADRYDALKGSDAAPHAHGTAIAGIVAARAQLASAAPEARLLAIRAFSGAKEFGAQGTTLHILRGVDWAFRAKARIVNMSFSGPADDALARFLAAGMQAGTVYVAAAGNAGPQSPPLFPAADPNVIAVTATDAEDRIFAAANRGGHICLAAPGVEVLVAAPAGAYGFTSGTSMAAAQVSGLVALMRQVKPDLSPQQVRAGLTAAIRDVGAPGPDPEFGAGLAEADSLMRALAEPARPPVEGMSATSVNP